MVSLCYLLMYLLNDNAMPLQPDPKLLEKTKTLIKRYKLMVSYKTKFKLSQMVKSLVFFPEKDLATMSHVKTTEVTEIKQL